MSEYFGHLHIQYNLLRYYCTSGELILLVYGQIYIHLVFMSQIQSRDNLGIAVVYNTGATHLFRVQSVSDDSSENISRQVCIVTT